MDTGDFVRAIARECDYTLQDTQRFLQGFVNVVYDCVKNREEIKIANFGVLSFTKIKERRVKGNPRFLDGKDKEYGESEKLFFRLSQTLKKLLKKTKKQENLEEIL